MQRESFVLMAPRVHPEPRIKIQRTPTVRLNPPQISTSVNIRGRAGIKLQVLPRRERQRNQSDFFFSFSPARPHSSERRGAGRGAEGAEGRGGAHTSSMTIELCYCETRRCDNEPVHSDTVLGCLFCFSCSFFWLLSLSAFVWNTKEVKA